MRYLLIVVIFFFSLSFVSAVVNVGDSKEASGVDITLPTAPINYSTIAVVNSSDYWDDLDDPTDITIMDDVTFTKINTNDWWDNSGIQLLMNWDTTLDHINISQPVNFKGGASLIFDDVVGSQIGQQPTQKIAFFGGTPIVQPSSTTDIKDALINLGLIATGGSTPLNLDGGSFTGTYLTVSTGYFGTKSISGGSITDSSNSISFGDEFLSTSSSMTAGQFYAPSGLPLVLASNSGAGGNTVDIPSDVLNVNNITAYGANLLALGSSTYGGLFRADTYLRADNKKYYLGASDDASINYNGSDLLINPREAGTGDTIFTDGDLFITGKVGVGTLTIPVAALMIYHMATNVNLEFGLSAGKLVINALNDARSAFVEFNIRGDPIVLGGGDVEVINNLDITGNITGNQIYGEMWYHNHTATILNFATDGLFYNLTFDYSDVNGFTFNDDLDYLEAQVAGKYRVNYMASGDGQNNHVYYTSVYVGIVNQDRCESHKKMTAGGDIVTMVGSCFVDLSIGDRIKLATADIGGTGTGNYYSSEINLVRIGD